MPKPAALRAVGRDETAPPKPEPTTLAAAVDGSERQVLVMIRHKIAAEVDAGVPAHALASLMKQLREIDRDIRAYDLAARAEAERAGEAADAPYDPEAN